MAGQVTTLVPGVYTTVAVVELVQWEVREHKAEQLVLPVMAAMVCNQALVALQLITAVVAAVALVLTAQVVWAVAAPGETLALLERLILAAAVELLVVVKLVQQAVQAS